MRTSLLFILAINLILLSACTGGTTITNTITQTKTETQQAQEITTTIITTQPAQTVTDTITSTVTTTITTTTTPLKALIPDTNLEAAISEEFYMSDRPIYISDLETLTSLEATGRYISDLTGLEYCTKLQVLEIPQNSISDLSPLSGLPSLKMLDLRSNNISDISPLVENSGLGEGDEVYLENNNLDLTEGSEDMQNIKALEDRGVEVHY
jgi:Leucine-rich repeat (LRR) protein